MATRSQSRDWVASPTPAGTGDNWRTRLARPLALATGLAATALFVGLFSVATGAAARTDAPPAATEQSSDRSPGRMATWLGWLGDRRSRQLLILGLALAALAVELFSLSRHGYLTGITEYDDGVYLGAASRLVHGTLPYRDFAFVAPPGVPLLMTPVALIGRLTGIRSALVIARLLTAVVTGANVALLGVLLRRRNMVTVVVACGCLAAYPAAILAGRTLLLEPYLVLFCLLGAILVFQGDELTKPTWLLLGGLAFGVAGAMKVWAIFPLVAVVVVCLPRLRGRVGPLVAGSAIGFAVPSLPFFVGAPGAFWRDVVLVQLERSGVVRTPVSVRLGYLTGAVGTTARLTSHELIALGVVIAGLVAAALLATGWRLRPLEAFAALSVALIVAAFLWSDAFYYHYAAFLGPFLALLVGIAAGRVAERLPHAKMGAVVAVALGAVLVINVNGAFFAARQTDVPAIDARVSVDRAIPAGACVVTDVTAYVVNANRFDDSPRSCPDVVDALGMTLALNHGRRPTSDLPATSVVVQTWLSDLSRCDYLILSGDTPERLPWTPAIAQYVQTHFIALPVTGLGGVTIYQRIPIP